VRRSRSYASSVAAALAALAPHLLRLVPVGYSDRLLARIIHEFPTASVESTAFSGPSPSGLLDVLFKYACVGLQPEGPESPVLSTLSRRQPMNNPG
jgi:hypothetical protein